MNALLKLILLGICIYNVLSSSINVIVSVRGKKYNVDAETVGEVIQQVEKSASLEEGQQVLLFRGKVLTSSDKLQEVGVSPGDILNVVKKRIERPKASLETSNQGESVSTSFDPSKMPDVNPDEMKKAMQAMDNLLDSDFIDEYFGDDEKLEKARLNMLENLDQYEKTIPGFRAQAEEIASDPQKWREAMQQAKEQLLKMKQKRDELRANKGSSGITDSNEEDEE